MTKSPRITGHLEISKGQTGIFIGGDPEALRSLANLLNWLAGVDQESLDTMPDGERCHVHLEPKGTCASLSAFSEETEICRLDAKGTGDFPTRYSVEVQKKATERASKEQRRRSRNRPSKRPPSK